MILFQPCPAHFPDLWKEERLVMPEITQEHLQAVRELYQFPDDDSEEAKLYFAKPSDLVRVYAKFWFQNAHGYLVQDGHLASETTIRGIDVLELLRDHEHLDLREACFERARRFSLPKEQPRLGWPSSMGRSVEARHYCLPCARQTWPPLP